MEAQFGQPKDFCPNLACANNGKLQHDPTQIAFLGFLLLNILCIRCL